MGRTYDRKLERELGKIASSEAISGRNKRVIDVVEFAKDITGFANKGGYVIIDNSL